MKPSELLLSHPRAFCKRTWARDREGFETDPCGKHAVSWCVHGAFKKCGIAYMTDTVLVAQNHCLDTRHEVLSGFNDRDRTTVEDVVKLLQEIGL